MDAVNSIEKSTANTMQAGLSVGRKKGKFASRNCVLVDMYGPNSSPYRGRVLKLELSTCEYPSHCPPFQFNKKINHANIDPIGRIHIKMVPHWTYQRGTINECLDKLFEWLKNPEEGNILTYSSILHLVSIIMFVLIMRVN